MTIYYMLLFLMIFYLIVMHNIQACPKITTILARYHNDDPSLFIYNIISLLWIRFDVRLLILSFEPVSACG
jgi:hypothetical protein